VPEAVARAWISQRPRGDLIIVKPQGKPFAVTLALVSTEVTQRLARPVQAMGSALINIFERRVR
jgi:hypothetical protein